MLCNRSKYNKGECGWLRHRSCSGRTREGISADANAHGAVTSPTHAVTLKRRMCTFAGDTANNDRASCQQLRLAITRATTSKNIGHCDTVSTMSSVNYNDSPQPFCNSNHANRVQASVEEVTQLPRASAGSIAGNRRCQHSGKVTEELTAHSNSCELAVDPGGGSNLWLAKAGLGPVG